MWKSNSYLKLIFVFGVMSALSSHAQSAQNLLGNSLPDVGAATSDTSSVVLGVKFSSDTDGEISGVRFYRAVESNSAYKVSLWRANGTLLASGRLARKSSAKAGYRQFIFDRPIEIVAGEEYVASYVSRDGQYAYSQDGFSSGISQGNLTAAAGAGLYRYGTGGAIPNSTYQNSNYFVDVIFTPEGANSNTEPEILQSLLDDASPTVGAETSDTSAVVLGVKFSSAVDGQIRGVRFYRAIESASAYTVSLWHSNGNLLATGNKAVNSNASPGYREYLFDNPVVINAGESYVASYLTRDGRYAHTQGGFSEALTNGDLTAQSGAGLYRYGSGNAIPNSEYNKANYFVDVLFAAASGSTSPSPEPAPEPEPEPSPAPTPEPNPTPSETVVPGPSEALHASQPYYTCVNNIYVATAAKGGNDNNSGSSAEPFLTLERANSSLPNDASGYCVNIGDGEYPTSNLQINKGGRVASMTGFVVYRATNLLGAKFVATSNTRAMIQIVSPYVIIDGIELDGKRLTNVDHGIDTCFNRGSFNGVHHVTVLNSYVHDVGGNGIAGCWGEYYWMIHNRSDGNAYNSWNSGISTYQPIEIPNYSPTAYDKRWTPYHNVYAYNRFDQNFTLPENGPHTDGNGLIYDDTRHHQDSSNGAYQQMALIMGNLSTNNGGAGIQIGPTSANADVFNNTCYNNYRDTVNSGTWRGELSSAYTFNVSFRNNIGIANPGSGILRNNTAFIGTAPVDGSNEWSNNIAFGGGVHMESPNSFSGNGNMENTDPLLANIVGGDFALCTGVGVPNQSCKGPSPAIGSGGKVPYWHQQTSGSIDIGACPLGAVQCR